MYTQSTLEAARRERRRALILPLICLGVALCGLILGLLLRVKTLAIIGLALPLMVGFFFFETRFLPEMRYARFVADVLSGRSHEIEGEIVSLGTTPRKSEEGVYVLDLMLRETGSDADTAFYWDDRLPPSGLASGQAVRGTAYGRFITALSEK